MSVFLSPLSRKIHSVMSSGSAEEERDLAARGTGENPSEPHRFFQKGDVYYIPVHREFVMITTEEKWLDPWKTGFRWHVEIMSLKCRAVRLSPVFFSTDWMTLTEYEALTELGQAEMHSKAETVSLARVESYLAGENSPKNF